MRVLVPGRWALIPSPILGDSSEGVPPVPIPNTEVKPFSPDGTARASVWESRTSPDYFPQKNPGRSLTPCRGFGVFRHNWYFGTGVRGGRWISIR